MVERKKKTEKYSDENGSIGLIHIHGLPVYASDAKAVVNKVKQRNYNDYAESNNTV